MDYHYVVLLAEQLNLSKERKAGPMSYTAQAKIKPWMLKVARNIVKNVLQFNSDYPSRPMDCVLDVAQEIANAESKAEHRAHQS